MYENILVLKLKYNFTVYNIKHKNILLMNNIGSHTEKYMYIYLKIFFIFQWF